MQWTTLLVNCCLLGQVTGGGNGLNFPTGGAPALTAPATPPATPAATPPAARLQAIDDSWSGSAGVTSPSRSSPSLAPVHPRRAGAVDILAVLLTAPNDKPVSGREVTLVEALTKITDRTRQIEAAHAYWALSVALAEYCNCQHDEQMFAKLLPVISARRNQDAILDIETRLQSARAALEEARLKMVTAQYALADRIGLTGKTLPLPADNPHVGPYNTRFEQIFASQPAPASLRLINRALPLEHGAIDSHAKALLASQDAVDAALELFQQGQTDWKTLVSCYDRCQYQRAGFLNAVLRYNRDIASYAIAVAPQSHQGEKLAELLIKMRPSVAAPVATAPGTTAPAGGAAPATFIESPPSTPAAKPGEPTLAPPRATFGAGTTGTTVRTPGSTGAESAPAEPRAFGPVMAKREPIVDVGLYSALQPLSGPRRAQELAELLNWDQQPASDHAKPLTLSELLSQMPAGSRREGIAAYWRARESAAQHQLLTRQLAQLDALMVPAVEQRAQPGGSEAMLRLQAARDSAKADVLDAQLRLLADEYSLARVAGQPNDVEGLHPTTLPHGGRYQMRNSAGSSAVARLHDSIPSLQTALQQRAAAVVTVDADRAALTTAYDAGSGSLDRASEVIFQQTAQTVAFLSLLTEYNREIAEYALAVLPPETSAPKLVTSLVIQRDPAK